MSDTQPPKVLVCDDDMMVRMLARECLESEGMLVIEAENGVQALELFYEETPDLLFLDVNMPLKNGLDVCAEIRATPAGRDVPVLIATGADDKNSIDRGFNAGATQYKTKPINWSLLSRDLRYMLRAADAFKQVQAQKDRLSYLAYFDQLTKLPNRRAFTDQLEAAVADVNKHNRQCALLCINIDHFKRINDSIGQSSGDEILRSFALRLYREVESLGPIVSDLDTPAAELENDALQFLLARPGGDEFTIIIKNYESIQEVENIALRLLQVLSEPMKLGVQSFVITPSIGLAFAPLDAKAAEPLLVCADAALHNAKETGRQRVRRYDSSLQKDSAEQLRIEQDLRVALAEDSLTMVYQPQIDTRSGKIAGAEALIRWEHPELGFIPPTDFIEVAERSGLIVELGNWILRRVNSDALRSEGKFPTNISVSINLSPLQFNQSDFVDNIIETLRELDSEYTVELELTEGVIMTDAEANITKLKRLKDLGFAIAIDDFGTGYSSLSYLRQFPVDTLKIDRSFINDLGTREGDGLVESILALSKAMSLTVVAEGVETAEQAIFLKKRGCQLLQGFLLERPLSPEGLIEACDKDYNQLLGGE